VGKGWGRGGGGGGGEGGEEETHTKRWDNHKTPSNSSTDFHLMGDHGTRGPKKGLAQLDRETGESGY